MLMRNIFPTVILTSLLLLGCKPHKSMGDDGGDFGDDSSEKTADASLYYAPTSVLAKSTAQTPQLNRVSLRLPPASKNKLVYIPFYFNSNQSQTITVAKPKYSDVGCTGSKIRLHKVEGTEVFGLEFARSREIPQNWVPYGRKKKLGNFNTDHSLILTLLVARECTNLNFEFVAVFE